MWFRGTMSWIRTSTMLSSSPTDPGILRFALIMGENPNPLFPFPPFPYPTVHGWNLYYSILRSPVIKLHFLARTQILFLHFPLYIVQIPTLYGGKWKGGFGFSPKNEILLQVCLKFNSVLPKPPKLIIFACEHLISYFLK